MNIILSKLALTDLKEIKDYISKNSVYYADVFTKNLTNSIRKLKDFPNIGRIVPEYQNKEIREIIYHSYQIIYKLYDDKINIITVIHGSRILEKHIDESDLS